MMYFRVAIVLFGAQLLTGLIAGIQFIYPNFLFEIFDFNVARMVHINALVRMDVIRYDRFCIPNDYR